MTTRELPDKIKQLDVLVDQGIAGSLVKDSIYNFSYAEDAPDKPAVGLFMPRTALAYQDAALFPVMDQNLPEGYLSRLQTWRLSSRRWRFLRWSAMVMVT